MRYPYMTLADETEISHSSMGMMELSESISKHLVKADSIMQNVSCLDISGKIYRVILRIRYRNSILSCIIMPI